MGPVLAGAGLLGVLAGLQVFILRGGLSNRGVAVGVLFVLGFYITALARAFAMGRLGGRGLDQALLLHASPWLLMLATLESSTPRNLDPSTTLLYGAFNACFAWALASPARPWAAGPSPAEPDALAAGPRWAWALGSAAALAAFILWSHRWANGSLRTNAPSDAIFLYFADRRSGIDFTPGAPYLGLAAAWRAFVWFGVAAGVLALLLRRFGPNPRVLLPVLVLLAVAGKLQVADLGPGGWRTMLPQKITSVHTNYYAMQPVVEKHGAWAFIKAFNQLQPSLGTHGETHPFGPELVYHGLKALAGANPTAISLLIMLLTACTVAPLWSLGASAFHSRWGGLAAAVLWISSPMSLIMSQSGIDSLIAFSLAGALALLDRGVRTRGAAWAAWSAGAGAFFFGASLLSTGAAPFLAFAVLWAAFVSAPDGSSGPADWLRRLLLPSALAAGVLLLLHAGLRLATGGAFDYLTVLRAALPVQKALTQVRPYAVWMPLNPLLFLGYAGVGLGGLFLARGLRFVWNPRRDAALVLAAAYLLTLMLSSLGNAEAQRIFQYALLILLLAGLPLVLRRDPDGALRLEAGLLAAVALANFANAVFLEGHVADYW